VLIRLVTVVLLGVCGVVAAQAADLSSAPRGEYGWYARRADMIAIYDYEPGVVVRAYWSTPWDGRHYFPHGRTPPRLGRRENLSLRGHAPPAQSFYRSWSNERAIINERRAAARAREEAPRRHEPLDLIPRTPPELK
jgi:hypothetical protein